MGNPDFSPYKNEKNSGNPEQTEGKSVRTLMMNSAGGKLSFSIYDVNIYISKFIPIFSSALPLKEGERTGEHASIITFQEPIWSPHKNVHP